MVTTARKPPGAGSTLAWEFGVMPKFAGKAIATPEPAVTSGIRLGTPAVTSRGMKEPEMAAIADMISEVLLDINNIDAIAKVRQRVRELTARFPLPY